MQDPRQALAGTLALLAATVAALFGLALADEPTTSGVADTDAPAQLPERPFARADALELARESTPQVARQIEAIRGLEFDRIPEPKVTTAAALTRKTQRQLERPRIQESMREAEATTTLLGLLEPGQRLDDVVADSSDAVAAYYDPRSGELFIVSDAATGPDATLYLLAHELTHALDDQRFGLPEGAGGEDDQVLAEEALVEGSAEAVSRAWVRHYGDQGDVAGDLLAQDPGAAAGLPAFVLAEFQFAYGEGARFVETIYDEADGWALVDFAFEESGPATTEQVIHPEKYLREEPAAPVPPPPAPGPGWRTVETSTLGEFGTRELVRAAEFTIDPAAAASGWAGDSFRLFARRGAPTACSKRCRSTHALGVRWRLDDGSEARELERALEAYVPAALDGKRAGPGRWSLDRGVAAVARDGELVGLGLAPGAATARRLADPG